jgi:hypothetical protein
MAKASGIKLDGQESEQAQAAQAARVRPAWAAYPRRHRPCDGNGSFAMSADNERAELGTGFLDRPIAVVLLVSTIMVSTFLAACFILLP